MNAYVGAWLLRRKVNKYGHSWRAVAAYHSETPDLGAAYVRHIRDILVRWKVTDAAGNPPRR